MKKMKKLSLNRNTLRALNDPALTGVAGGPGHRTTNRCTANVWQTCHRSWCVCFTETRCGSDNCESLEKGC